jgi:CHAD domain-containing protein
MKSRHYAPKNTKPVLRPDEPSSAALRQILRLLLRTLRANVDGVLEDLDEEFLHDLRVATRRTRSALTQIPGVLPRSALKKFRPEFKWLGIVTGRCRDLDVFLLDMEAYRRQLGESAKEVDPILEPLKGARQRAHSSLCSSLRSRRFERLIEGWAQFLESPSEGGDDVPNDDRPISDLAGERILKAHRRVVKRGSKLVGDSPADALHRLRIDAKKLRYLLEFFACLYPEATIGRLVRELKRLQNNLGGFNDIEVQRSLLADFDRKLLAAGDARAEALPAMGRLAAAMEQRQQEYRHALGDSFGSFSGDDSRRLYRTLLSRTVP